MSVQLTPYRVVSELGQGWLALSPVTRGSGSSVLILSPVVVTPATASHGSAILPAKPRMKQSCQSSLVMKQTCVPRSVALQVLVCTCYTRLRVLPLLKLSLSFWHTLKLCMQSKNRTRRRRRVREGGGEEEEEARGRARGGSCV